MKIQVPYPDKQDEVEIMKTVTSDSRDTIHCVSMDDFQATIQTIESIHIDEKIYEYIAEIIDHTRDLEATNRYILHGASPRASIAFVRCARVLAVMNGRDFVLPEDIKSLAKQILRHRIIRAYEAIGDEVSTDQIVERILQAVKVP